MIHTDKFSNKFDNPPPYVECLRLDELSNAIEARDRTKVCLIEGICLRDVLAECGALADGYIYIRRKGQNGLWYDKFHLEEFESGGKSGHDDVEPHLSDMRYYSAEKPHIRADIYYDRIESD